MILVKFVVVDRPSAYNAIFGRTAQTKLKAVASIPHLCMKFPTEAGVGVVRGEQRTSRECYNTTLKNFPERVCPDKGAKPTDK
jgi:hypothetical protein